jgi:hypothetical protein
VILAEICERIQIKREPDGDYEGFHPVLSLLGYLMKAPVVPEGVTVVNALNAQRQAIVNVFKACVGLPPDDFMDLHSRVGYFIFFSLFFSLFAVLLLLLFPFLIVAISSSATQQRKKSLRRSRRRWSLFD